MDLNQQIIDTFRANAGEVNEPIPFGKKLVLVHVPRNDGSERVVPLVAVEQDGAWHVAATAGGSPKHPVWVHTLRRADTVTVEAPGDPILTAPVTVAELEGTERDELWERFKDVLPSFAGYEKKSGGRVFPIFRLAP